MIKFPFAERTTDAPGSMTTVVKLDSTIAGPSTRAPEAIAWQAVHLGIHRPGAGEVGGAHPAALAVGDGLHGTGVGHAADGATRPRAPRHRLDVRIAIGDGEHLLVQVVQVRDQPLDIGRIVEAPLCQRHLDLPDLMRIAGLDGELDALRHPGGAAALEEGPALRLQLLQGRIDRLGREAVAGGEAGAAELGAEIGHQRADGAEGGTDVGDDHPLAAEPPRDLHGVEARRAAAADQHGLARIDALIDGDVLDGVDHVLADDIEDGGGGLVRADTERSAHLLGNRRRRAVGIERDGAAQEEVGVDVAQRERGVGQGRLAAALTVAGGARHRARAVGADVQHAARIDPGDGAAAGANAAHVDGGEARHVAANAGAEPRLPGPGDPPLADQRDVIAGAARVGDDGHALVALGGSEGAAGDGRHRRAGVQRVDRGRRQVGRIDDTALGGHGQQPALEPGVAQPRLQGRQVAGHDRLQRGVDAGARRPPVLPQRRVQAVGERIRHAG